MSSALESAVTDILDNDYVSLVMLTAIGYDYILTFSDEIEYIWNKPWTWVSTLFILIRYFGLYSSMVCALLGSSFVPGPEKIHVVQGCFKGNILGTLSLWCLDIFIGAADLAMILRVWALYGQSRIILGILLTLYVLEMIAFLVSCISATVPNYVTMTVDHLLDFSFCVQERNSRIWFEVDNSLQFLLSAAMCLLAIAQFIQQSYQLYRMTKTWQLSRYVNLLVRESMLYFFAILLYTASGLFFLISSITISAAIPLMILEYVPMFTLTPRFILSVRVLYARDLLGRRGSHLDTDFGFTSEFGRGVGGSAIAFAVRSQNEEGLGQDEEMPMGERGMRKDNSSA